VSAAEEATAQAPILRLDGISLAFGGVTVLDDVSFDIREGEIRAIIGPNGAGKSSMLNVINGFYHPDDGTITYKGETRTRMRPDQAARQGIARTFQNIALFRGMSTLDNIMTGRLLKTKYNFMTDALFWGPAQTEEIRHREFVEPRCLTAARSCSTATAKPGRGRETYVVRINGGRDGFAPTTIRKHGGRRTPPRCRLS